MEKKLCILLFEDDPFQREVIREYLDMEGRYLVYEAKGIYHALAICECAHPSVDVVLLDMAMTRVDMVDLVLAIRDRRPDMAILGMTDCPADLYEEPRLRASRAGFIPKPFNPFRLDRSIQAVIRDGSTHRWHRTRIANQSKVDSAPVRIRTN